MPTSAYSTTAIQPDTAQRQRTRARDGQVVYIYNSTRGRRCVGGGGRRNYYLLVASVCECTRRCRAVRRTLKIQPCQGQARTHAHAFPVHLLIKRFPIVIKNYELYCTITFNTITVGEKKIRFPSRVFFYFNISIGTNNISDISLNVTNG